MRKFSLYLALLCSLVLAGCDQYLARNYGGNVTLTELPANAKLVHLTWKENSIWMLYYLPDTKQCVFKESASVGVLEGVVTIPNCNPLMLGDASQLSPSAQAPISRGQ